MLYALPEPPALPAFAARVRRIGTVELVREDRLGDVDVDAAELVDQLREAVEVDHHHVVDRQAGVRVHRPLGEPGSPDLEGRVDLVGPVAGDVRDAEVAWDREVDQLVVLRIGAEDLDGVRVLVGRARSVQRMVGAEQEDVARVREQHPLVGNEREPG